MGPTQNRKDFQPEFIRLKRIEIIVNFFNDNCKIKLPVDGGYPLVRPLKAPIEETDDAAEVALPKWVADPE